MAARFDYLLAELEEPFELDGVKIAAAELNNLNVLPPNINVGYAGYGAEHHGVNITVIFIKTFVQLVYQFNV